MFLACDVGNSLIKIGVFKNDKLIEHIKIIPEKLDVGIFAEYDISGAAVSSVNKKSSSKIIDLITENFGVIPFEISTSKKLNLKLDYETPETLGIDRICGAEGAFYIFRKSEKEYTNDDFIISIDFGTATTFNLVKYDGVFTGGLIAPGISMMSHSLSSETAQLPEVNLSDFTSTIGKSTKSSIASGIINATLGMINSVLDQLDKENSAAKFHIYITGGNAGKILPHLNFSYSYQPALVLYGIKSIYGKNR